MKEEIYNIDNIIGLVIDMCTGSGIQYHIEDTNDFTAEYRQINDGREWEMDIDTVLYKLNSKQWEVVKRKKVRAKKEPQLLYEIY